MSKKIRFVLSLLLVTATYSVASDSAGISGTVTTLPEEGSSQSTLSLDKNWNLIGPNANLTLSFLKEKIGANNLLVIQGPSKSYKKENVDNGTDFLNDFTRFEEGKGYWIKVANAVNIDFTATTNTKSISLSSGWNLINPTKSLTIAQIIDQVGRENLLIIQGPEKSYKKENVDNGTAFLNDFTNFEEPKGYWIKVSNSATLNF